MKTWMMGLMFTVMALPVMAQHTEPAPVKAALLVIDVQNAYMPYMDEANPKSIFDRINGSIALFRQFDLPVIRVYHSDPRWGTEVGTDAFQFDPAVSVNDSDPKVIKHYPSAFRETELQQLLKDQGINTLFLTGLSATGCVMATYWGAIGHDYDVFLVRDNLFSGNAVHTKQVQEILQSVSYEAVKIILKASAQ